MQPHDPTVQALAERVAKLETQNRRFRKAAIASLVVASAVAVMGQARTSGVLEADEFVLKDNSGTVRARMSVDTATDRR
jgi:phosphohistidine phosphatase SixA